MSTDSPQYEHSDEPEDVLWKSADESICLVDIPASLRLAQATPSQPWPYRIVSDPPRKSPFHLPEPRTTQARARIRPLPPSPPGLQVALDQIRNGHNGPWCFERFVGNPSTSHVVDVASVDWQAPSLCLDAHCSKNFDELTNRVVINQSPGKIHIKSTEEFWMPPHSAFFLAKVTAETALQLSMAANFNLVIMDPPWPNRSARRGQKYAVSDDPFDLLYTTLPSLLAPNAVVACWITNKDTVREKVLAAFEHWGMALEHEWIWIKVTSNGEFVVPLDSVWRRPYELLLIGRSKSVQSRKTRRIIVAVPDVHSRKPHLGRQLRTLVDGNPRALEIFARNLTADTWAWGDECLHYATESAWASMADNDNG